MTWSLQWQCLFFITYNLWGGSCPFCIYHFLTSYYVGCEHLCQSIIEILLFDQWLFITIVITNICLLNLLNARCLRMCRILRVHFFEIGCHWSFFLFNLLFPFLLSGSFALVFSWQYMQFVFWFFHLPTLSIYRMPHFLIYNSLRKGSNWLSSWRIHHGCPICL